MSELSDALLTWYAANKRDLPWRETYDPYRVWLSEIMLQQTRVDTVIPYYNRFLKAFPDVKALSHAEEDQYLKLWEGLGYYSRVKNLVKGARLVQEEYLGIIPDKKEELLKIPGIGEYTANAIMAFAFGEPVVTVDGNLIRVYARLDAASIVPNDSSSKKACDGYFKGHVTEENSRDFNQALMDLGELVCLPNGEPRCHICPLRACCKANQLGTPMAFPLKKKKIEKRIEHRQVFILIYRNNVALFKRPDQGLLAGMYEYLNVSGEDNLKPEKTLQNLGIHCNEIIHIGKKKHVFTHLIWEMDGYVCVLDKPCDATFVSKSELKNRYSVPSAFAAFTQILLDDYLR